MKKIPISEWVVINDSTSLKTESLWYTAMICFDEKYTPLWTCDFTSVRSLIYIKIMACSHAEIIRKNLKKKYLIKENNPLHPKDNKITLNKLLVTSSTKYQVWNNKIYLTIHCTVQPWFYSTHAYKWISPRLEHFTWSKCSSPFCWTRDVCRFCSSSWTIVSSASRRDWFIWNKSDATHTCKVR